MTTDIERIMLERKDFFYQHARDLTQFKATSHNDFDTGHIVERLRASVYGEPLQSGEFNFPDGWYEAFRERWFPKFMLKRKPIKYLTYKQTSYAMYPDLKPSIDSESYYYTEFKGVSGDLYE